MHVHVHYCKWPFEANEFNFRRFIVMDDFVTRRSSTREMTFLRHSVHACFRAGMHSFVCPFQNICSQLFRHVQLDTSDFFSGMKLTGVWIFTLSFLDRLMALFDFLFLCMELVRMVMKMLFIADPIHLFFCIFLPEIPLEKSCPQFHLYLLFYGNIVGFLAMIWRYLCGLHFYSGIFYIITAFLALNYSLWLINTSNKHGLL